MMRHVAAKDGAVPESPSATRKGKKRTAAPPIVTIRPVTRAVTAAAALAKRRVTRAAAAAAAAAAAGETGYYRALWTAQSEAAARKRRKPGGTRVPAKAAATEPSGWHARAGTRCINDALPEELIGQILRQLPDLSDFGKARCVCKTWNQVGASPFHRPASPLCCLIPLSCGGGWRRIDMASEREGKIAYPGTSSVNTPKGQGGLFAVEEAFSKYWICNPLLNKWQKVPVSAAETLRVQQKRAAGGIWTTTFELLVGRAQAGSGSSSPSSSFSSSSYKIVRVVHVKHSLDMINSWHGATLQTEIYDSQSRVWTKGAHVQQQGNVPSVLSLRSCVWRSMVYVLIGVAHGYKFSIWEYNVENDTLAETVPLASLPGLRVPWSRNTPLQVQVRDSEDSEHGATTHLVVGRDGDLPAIGWRRAPCYHAPPFQVFAWDPSLELWTLKMEVQSTANQPARSIKPLPGAWDGKSDWASVPEFLFGHPCVIRQFRAGKVLSSRLSVAVCRTDVDTTFTAWHCNMKAQKGDCYLHSCYNPGFCFFPDLDAQA